MSSPAGSAPAESLLPQGAGASPEPTGAPNVARDLPSSEQTCQSCQVLVDNDSSSVLTQRRSMGEKSSKFRPLEDSSTPSHQMPWFPSIAIWAIAALGLTMLLICLTLFEKPEEWLELLIDLPARVYSGLIPVGANLWLFQWRYQGQIDPRPLWDPAMMGSSAKWLHGSSGGLSHALEAASSKRVAVVGNGPITDAQRLKINEADMVVRFNAMNNRREEERVDLWIVRNNHMMPYLYWGFEQLGDDEVVRLLEKAKAVLFLSDFASLTRGINKKAEVLVTNFVQEWFSSARDEQLHQVDITPYWQLYTNMFSKTGQTRLNTTDVMPSSGLLGILAVLDLIPKDSKVELYGFNWNVRSYVQHMMSTEELIIQALTKTYTKFEIHPTACNGLYHCNQICDTAQFRLAVDEQNCIRQVAKAGAGEEARFIDLHTTQHLEWHASLLAELKAKAKHAGFPKPSKAMLKNMAQEMADGHWLASIPASAPETPEEEISPAPAIFHQKVSLAKLVAGEDHRARVPILTGSEPQEPQAEISQNKEARIALGHVARKLRRPQPHL